MLTGHFCLNRTTRLHRHDEKVQAGLKYFFLFSADCTGPAAINQLFVQFKFAIARYLLLFAQRHFGVGQAARHGAYGIDRKLNLRHNFNLQRVFFVWRLHKIRGLTRRK